MTSQPCYLEGYPDVRLSDNNGAALAFAYARTGDQVVTSAPPRPVTIASGGIAYVTINKFRCDLADRQIAGGIAIALPGGTGTLRATLGQLPTLGYCGDGDPGSTVDVSPVEPSFAATRAR